MKIWGTDTLKRDARFRPTQKENAGMLAEVQACQLSRAVSALRTEHSGTDRAARTPSGHCPRRTAFAEVGHGGVLAGFPLEGSSDPRASFRRPEFQAKLVLVKRLIRVVDGPHGTGHLATELLVEIVGP